MCAKNYFDFKTHNTNLKKHQNITEYITHTRIHLPFAIINKYTVINANKTFIFEYQIPIKLIFYVGIYQQDHSSTVKNGCIHNDNTHKTENLKIKII